MTMERRSTKQIVTRFRRPAGEQLRGGMIWSMEIEDLEYVEDMSVS